MMSKIVDLIGTIPNLRYSKPCTTSQVMKAQEALNLVFPDEYVEYVKRYGDIRFYGTEWTGLNVPGYLNTVEATLQEMRVNPSFPKGFFIIEDLGIDAKLAVVNREGQVFLLQHDRLSPICSSLSDYLSICIGRNQSIT